MAGQGEGWLIGEFEANRDRLRSVAYRMLGSESEAEDAVQDTWIRLGRSDAQEIDNFAGWLTTVVARVCLDRLRSRRSRPEYPASNRVPDNPSFSAEELDPEDQALIAESVGSALLVVLDLLAPSERVAFVLHDVFAVPYDEIGAIIGRSTDASRQLASRARRRLQDDPAAPHVDLPRQREVIEAFLAASRGGNFDALLTLLDPDVQFRADEVAHAMPGVPEDQRGAHALAGRIAGRAQGAQLALIDGVTGLVWAPGGRPRGAFLFRVIDGRIAQISLIADPERIAELDIVTLTG